MDTTMKTIELTLPADIKAGRVREVSTDELKQMMGL